MSFPQMYNLNRKLDQKAQLTGKKDEDSNPEDEVLYEKLNLPNKSFRPSSAKAAELLKQKRSTNPKHPPINLKRNQTKNLGDSSVLTRLKPRRITMDKERLYEENMALKLKNNNLLQEILKLRTKVAQVERELVKKDDNTETSQFTKPAHMINNLKGAVKELKSEISIKDEEIHRLKKNFKSTKLNEMELEVQAYIDECTRLRHHLEEIMRQRSSPPMSQPMDGDMQNTFSINSIKKENEELSQALSQSNQEISRLKGKLKEIEKDKKKNLVKKNEISQLKAENIKLKSKVDHYSRELAEKELIFKEELNKVKRNLNEAYAKVNNNEGKIKNLICENEEKSKQIKFLQENKMIQKKFAESSKEIRNNENNEKELVLTGEDKDFNSYEQFKDNSEAHEGRFEMISSGQDKLDIESDDESSCKSGKNEKENKLSAEEGKACMGIDEKSIKKGLESDKEFESDSEDYDENFEDFEDVKTNQVLKQKDDEDDVKRKEEILSDKKNENQSDEDYSSDLEQNEVFEPKVEMKVDKIYEDTEIGKVNEDSKNLGNVENRDSEKIDDSKDIFKGKPEEIEGKEIKSKEKKEKSREKQDDPQVKKQDDPQVKKQDDPQVKIDKPLEVNDKVVEKTPVDQSDPSKKPKKSSKSKKSKPDKSKPSDLLFRHLALRLQINRVPRSKLGSFLFKSLATDKPVPPSDLTKIFISAPFNFSKPESESLCTSILESSKLTPKQIEEKLLKQLENWEIYSAEEEEKIDETIGQTILKQKDRLIEACSAVDSSSSGTITLKNFKKIIQQLQIKLPEKVFKYMQLLFYSHNMNFEEVPYLNFIKAYTELPEDDFSDEEKAKVARHYLAIIAQILIQNNRTVFDLFECDDNGLINPNGFLLGLQRLGLEEIEEEHVMILLEALQFDQAEEVCVHIEELEEILNHYGVAPEGEEGEGEGEGENGGQGHLKKVSLLDDENYDEGEEPIGRNSRKGPGGRGGHALAFGKQGIDENEENEYDEDFN